MEGSPSYPWVRWGPPESETVGVYPPTCPRLPHLSDTHRSHFLLARRGTTEKDESHTRALVLPIWEVSGPEDGTPGSLRVVWVEDTLLTRPPPPKGRVAPRGTIRGRSPQDALLSEDGDIHREDGSRGRGSESSFR